MTVSGSMLLSEIACLAAGFSPAGELFANDFSSVNEGICTNPGVFRTVLSLVAKSFITCCFVGIYSF